ncbi:MAG TPA: RecQ family ATP-dependent DNA helicase, partial [Haloplasmataceae bacterium]
DIYKGLKTYFGYDKYRDFDGVPLQEKAVLAAVNNKSLLAVFPTGGGKSITYQIPALIAGRSVRGLTVVISPLQSLMKDQVDNLEKLNITEAVTINGLLNPLERAKSFERVANGDASILYISPESLRSRTIENLLLGRKISRFVIDEAHCFSAWGQDFRVDYLYIADFIKNLQEKKHLTEPIPVSCFTATAKQNVVNDIIKYFKDKLNLELELFIAKSKRKNLSYKVIKIEENEKYNVLRNLLEKNCPTIVYVSTTSKAENLALRLNKDGYNALAYHGKMDKITKSKNQDDFVRGDVNIMVATSAFGMGVDKKDVEMVIHYDISDSLENYLQESGRAGRDSKILANCYILFNENDLDKHFLLLNQTKLTIQEIQQVWRAIKIATKSRSKFSQSALEIAREAGWDENIKDIENRVTTAIAALENAGYIKRGQNMPKVFADSILAKSAIEAIDKIKKTQIFNSKEEEEAIRIIRKLISSRSIQKLDDEIPETRVDYISDILGIEKKEVINIIEKLKEAKVLDNAKDLVVYIDDNDYIAKGKNTFLSYKNLEIFLLDQVVKKGIVVNIKELNELAEEQNLKNVNPKKITNIFNYWSVRGFITRDTLDFHRNILKINLQEEKEMILKEFDKRHDICLFILEYFQSIYKKNDNEILFSVLELKEKYELQMQLLMKTASITDIENALYYLSKIGAIRIEGGFLVIYQPLSIERLEKDNKIRYKVEDYQQLKKHYEHKTEMIHIVGTYAKMLIESYKSALQFVDDYFSLEYSSFLRKYFKGSKNEDIKRNITPEKFKKLFGELSIDQLKIINDQTSQFIVVAAGPGSGKTRILVHKLASLLLMEDIKHEQLMMLTFSRAAATEFKKRLINLVGNAANFVEIKTFHSYCFDILGRVGNIERAQDVIKEAVLEIENGEIESSRITKSVLVIDEAQDIEESEYQLINALINKNDNIRIIAVGDDDQNIFSFRGSSAKYMQELLNNENAKMYELINNYRSKANLVAFTNIFIEKLSNRLKKTPILPNNKDNGKIEIIEYESNHIIVPAVKKMLSEGLRSSSCILTTTNEEALQVVGLLRKNNINVKLIQSNENFNLINLFELRYFLNELKLTKETYKITDEAWQEAKKKFKDKFINSDNYLMCDQLLRDIEIINSNKYKSDLIQYLLESKTENLLEFKSNQVIVSTIHKSKGWEFDHIILILNHYNINNDDNVRLLYVGMTRAKESLTIHYNGNYLSDDYHQKYRKIKNLIYKKDKTVYNESNILLVQLGYKDVYLSFFYNTQKVISELMSGDILKVDDYGCLDKDNRRVLKYSNKFKEELSKLRERGYVVKSAKVKYIIYWKEENANQEILILLPELEMEKTNN